MYLLELFRQITTSNHFFVSDKMKALTIKSSQSARQGEWSFKPGWFHLLSLLCTYINIPYLPDL